MPEGLTSFASQWCFFLILQPLLGHREGGKLVSVSSEQWEGVSKHARGGRSWAHSGANSGTRSPVAQVGWGSSGRGRGAGVATEVLTQQE